MATTIQDVLGPLTGTEDIRRQFGIDLEDPNDPLRFLQAMKNVVHAGVLQGRFPLNFQEGWMPELRLRLGDWQTIKFLIASLFISAHWRLMTPWQWAGVLAERNRIGRAASDSADFGPSRDSWIEYINDRYNAEYEISMDAYFPGAGITRWRETDTTGRIVNEDELDLTMIDGTLATNINVPGTDFSPGPLLYFQGNSLWISERVMGNIVELYFVSNPSTNIDASLAIVNTLIQGIETSFPNTTRQQTPWSLSYRAFRDTIPPGYQPPAGADGKPEPYVHSYQHLLHVSSLSPNRTYVFAQPRAQQETMTSIPLRQQDAHASVLRYQCSALWTPRHILAVREGASYSGGLCSIQIGELRATREGPQSGAISSPGVVVCISTTLGAEDTDGNMDSGYGTMENGAAMQVDEEDLDIEYAQAVVRDCWSRIKDGRDLGRSEIREVMMASTTTNKKGQEQEAAVRMWCDALRMRG
ncbi:hypothetical protein J4E89_002281 [Alternaria sp. Ai002NY15]|nr:hypothetical protein J4E89_002281 [Alternaria sp. Ai002NY15]